MHESLCGRTVSLGGACDYYIQRDKFRMSGGNDCLYIANQRHADTHVSISWIVDILL